MTVSINISSQDTACGCYTSQQGLTSPLLFELHSITIETDEIKSCHKKRLTYIYDNDLAKVNAELFNYIK